MDSEWLNVPAVVDKAVVDVLCRHEATMGQAFENRHVKKRQSRRGCLAFAFHGRSLYHELKDGESIVMEPCGQASGGGKELFHGERRMRLLYVRQNLTMGAYFVMSSE